MTEMQDSHKCSDTDVERALLKWYAHEWPEKKAMQKAFKWHLSLQAWSRGTVFVLKHGCLCPRDNSWPWGLHFTPLGEVT